VQSAARAADASETNVAAAGGCTGRLCSIHHLHRLDELGHNRQLRLPAQALRVHGGRVHSHQGAASGSSVNVCTSICVSRQSCVCPHKTGATAPGAARGGTRAASPRIGASCRGLVCRGRARPCPGVAPRAFFTVGYRAAYRGNRSYRWGTVMVPSGRNRPQHSNLNLN
jgi:hypothetical protein